jgi:multidrug efflux pump subunit AcrB
MSEQQLNDLGQNFLRPQLVTVPGAVVPWPYGGKTRQVMIDLNTALLQAKGVSPTDVLNAVANEYVVLPGGTAKIDQFEYDMSHELHPAHGCGIKQSPCQASWSIHDLPS